MTKPDSTDAVTGERWLLQQSKFTNAEVNRILDRAEKAEAALATLTRERDGLRGLAARIVQEANKPRGIGAEPRIPTSLLRELEAAAEPATPPAPLPGGHGPVEALRREIVEALDQFADSWHTDARILARQLSDRLEQGGEGREG